MKAKTSTNPIPAIIIITLLIIIVAIGLYFSNNLEKRITKVPVPRPYYVLLNPYLAAEHFLKKQNRKVSNQKHLLNINTLPSKKQTILLLASDETLTAEQVKQTLHWVSQGGYLIVEASTSKHSNRDLLKTLGIQITIQPLQKKYSNKDLLTHLYVEDGSEPALLAFSPKQHLEDTKNRAYTWANSNNNATHIMQLRYNQGLITVISDANIWTNDQIQEYDHAWLLDYLTTDTDITIITPKPPKELPKEQPSLLEAVIKHFGYTLALLLLFIMLYLWYKGTRHGPIEKAALRDRRHLPEYLNASATFLMKFFNQQELLHTLQQDIQHKAKKHHAGFETLPLEDQWKLLARLSNKASKDISKCMRPLAPNKKLSQLEFIKIVITLQEIRNNI